MGVSIPFAKIYGENPESQMNKGASISFEQIYGNQPQPQPPMQGTQQRQMQGMQEPQMQLGGAAETLQSWAGGAGDAFQDTRWPEKMPLVGGVLEHARISNVMSAMEALKSGETFEATYGGFAGSHAPQRKRPITEEERKAYIKKVEDYVLELEKESEREPNFGREVTNVLIDAAPFMVEFFATAGLASLGKTAVKKAAINYMKKYATKEVLESGLTKMGVSAAVKTGMRGAGWMAGEATRLPAFVGHVLKNQGHNQLAGQGEAESFFKAIGDTYIELLSESSGEGILKLGEKIPVLNKLFKGWSKSTGGSKADFLKKMTSQAGYQGILGEMGEERLGDALRAVTGVQDFGLEGDDNTILNRLYEAVPSLRQLATEATAFAVPAVGLNAASSVADRMDQNAAEDETIKENLWEQYPAKARVQGEERVSFTEEHKQNLLSAEGAYQFTEEFPDAIDEIIAKPNPSRGDFEKWGIPPLKFNAEERSKLARNVSAIMYIDGMEERPSKKEIRDKFGFSSSEEARDFIDVLWNKPENKSKTEEPLSDSSFETEREEDDYIYSEEEKSADPTEITTEEVEQLLNAAVAKTEIEKETKFTTTHIDARSGRKMEIRPVKEPKLIKAGWNYRVTDKNGTRLIRDIDPNIGAISSEPESAAPKQTWAELKAEAKSLGVPIKGNYAALLEAVKEEKETRPAPKPEDPASLPPVRPPLPSRPIQSGEEDVNVQKPQNSEGLGNGLPSVVGEQVPGGEISDAESSATPDEASGSVKPKRRTPAAKPKTPASEPTWKELKIRAKEAGVPIRGNRAALREAVEKAENEPVEPSSSGEQRADRADATQALIDRITMGESGIEQAREIIDGNGTLAAKSIVRGDLEARGKTDGEDYVGMVGEDVFTRETKTPMERKKEELAARKKARGTVADKSPKPVPSTKETKPTEEVKPSSKPKGDTQGDKQRAIHESLFWKEHEELDELGFRDRAVPIPKLWRKLKDSMSRKEFENMLDRLSAGMDRKIQLERTTTMDALSQEEKDDSYHNDDFIFYIARRLSTEAELKAQRAKTDEILKRNEEEARLEREKNKPSRVILDFVKNNGEVPFEAMVAKPTKSSSKILIHPSSKLKDHWQASLFNEEGRPVSDFFDKDYAQLLKQITEIGYLDISNVEVFDTKKKTPSSTEELFDQMEQEADARPEIEEMHSGFGAVLPSKRNPLREDQILSEMEAPEENERRLKKSHGAKKQPWGTWVRDIGLAAIHKASRAEEFIPNTQKFKVAHELFRLLKVIPESADDEASRRVASIVDPLGAPGKHLFERYLLMRNLHESIQRGEPLRFGFTAEGVEEYTAKLLKLVKRVPSVQEALENRRKALETFTAELQDYKVIPEGLDRDHYFHQQVLDRMNVQRIASGSGAKHRKRSWQKHRLTGVESLDAEYDYNTDYIEAEKAWMTEAIIELEKEKMLRKMDAKYGILDKLKKQAKDKNWENLVGGPENVRRIEELREEIGTIRGLGARQTLDPRKRKILEESIEELNKLDPTTSFRRDIAKGFTNITEALTGETEEELDFDLKDYPGWNALERKFKTDNEFEILEKIEDSDKWFSFIGWLASQQSDNKAVIGARMVYKAISERKKFIEEELGNDFLTLDDMIRDAKDYSTWFPGPSSVFYRAVSLPEKIAADLKKGVLEEASLTVEQLREVTAITTGRFYVLPNEIVDQLESMEKPKLEGVIGGMSKDAMRLWKQWTLLSPKRALGYSLRNVTGDADPVIGGAPGALLYTKRAIEELHKYHRGNLSISKDLRNARDLGVINSSMTAMEIPNIKELNAFKRFYDPQNAKSKNYLAKYFEFIKDKNEFRENLLRYSSYLYYLDKIKKKQLTHYGGASKTTVDAVIAGLGAEEGAAHLARNLLGDYGNLTVMGDWLRMNAIPFWSWQEVNMTRYPHLVKNAFRWGKQSGKKVSGGVLGTVAGGVFAGVALSQLAGVYAAMWAFNTMVFGDDEEQLSSYERANPHILLGHNEDGTIRILRNTGALGDMLEWAGLNTLMSMWNQYQNGQVSGKDLAIEMVKDPLNKIVQGARPDIKGLAETVSGYSVFPDATNPRKVKRSDALMSIFGLNDEYRVIKGALTKDGTRARPHYLERLIGVSDPKPNALFEILDLRNKFILKEGGTVGSSARTSPTKTMRDAAQMDDFKAFQQARGVYIKSGKGFSNYYKSLQYLDPLHSRLSDEKEARFEHEFLKGTQREKLKIARAYSHDTRIKMWNWWQEAAKSDSKEQQASLETETKKQLGSLLYGATDPKAGETEGTISDLRAMGVTTKKQAVDLLRTEYARRYKKKLHEVLPMAGRKITAYGRRIQALNKLYSSK